MTRQQENSLKELETLQKMLPVAPFATSDRRGWKGLQAARYRKNVANGEFSASATMHMLALTIQPAEKMDLRYEGIKRDIPLPPGSISMVPAGSSVRWRRQGSIDALFISLDPSQVARIATESFGFDPTRTVVPPVVGLNLPELRSAMLAVDAELKSGGFGGPLMAESLANILAVHLIRHTTGARRLPASADGVLLRRKLRTVIEYIMENLEGSLTLEQMAAVVHLSPYHFARQFKAATGLPPHQYLTTRRVERAQQLLRADGELGLAAVALRVGFSDQSQFSLHFKRIVGVTPREFRISAGTRQKSASSTKNSDPNSVGMLLDDFHARRLHGLIGCRAREMKPCAIEK
jgi:AraC family transcriptional regulator